MDDRSAWDRFWKYDRLSSFGTGQGSANYPAHISQGWQAFFRSLPESARILDIATGNGAVAVMAIEANKGFKVAGADLADVKPGAFVSHSKKALKQIRFLAGTPAEELPLPDASFDAVVSQYGVEYSDMRRSVPEAARVLAPGGRLRFACHAAAGTVAADTRRAIADADYLLDELDLTGRAAACFEAVLGVERQQQSGRLAEIAAQARYAQFRDGLKAVADRLPTAADQAMLTAVHKQLTDLFQDRQSHAPETLSAKTSDLREEIAAHRERQRALLDAALSADDVARLADQLRSLGLSDVELGEQSDGDRLIGHVIEARKPD